MESHDEFQRRMRHEQEVREQRQMQERHHRERIRAMEKSAKAAAQVQARQSSYDSGSPEYGYAPQESGGHWLGKLLLLLLILAGGYFAILRFLPSQSSPAEETVRVPVQDGPTQATAINGNELPSNIKNVPSVQNSKVYPVCSETVTDNCRQME